jgi:PAS domain S-box-containing protein
MMVYYELLDRDLSFRAQRESVPGTIRMAEDTRRSPKAPEPPSFRERLTALNKVTVDLALCTAADELCRRAVEQASVKLGFERIGVWLTVENASDVCGTFGIDEDGLLRDERESRIEVHPKSLMGRILQGGIPFYMEETGPLYDDKNNEIGTGSHAVAPLWDGTRIIGVASIDNSLTREPLTQQDCELLGLFSSSLGALLSRLWAEEACRTVVDNSLQGLAVFHGSRVVFANAALEQITGYNVAEIVAMEPGQAEEALVHPEDLPWLHELHKDRMAGKPVPSHYELRLVRKNGDVVWTDVFAVSIPYRGQRAMQVAFVDITDRKAADAALRESETNFRAMANNAREGICILDPEGQCLYVNRFFCKMVNLPIEHVLGGPVLDLVAEGEKTRVSGMIGKALRGEELPQTFETTVLTADGHELVVEVTGAATTWRGQDATLGMVRDITARRQLQREVIEVERREQRRIGRDLHDALGQELTGIAYMAKALHSALGKTAPELAESAEKLEETARHALAQCRHIAHGLLPVQLDEEGLVHELSQLAARMRSLYGVDCDCTVGGGGQVHNHTVALHLYYIAQEAVSNTLRHSNARSIRISLRMDGQRGELVIADNGQWQHKDDDDEQGMGLRIMEYRARVIDGHLRLEHGDGQGTRVVCTFEDRE